MNPFLEIYKHSLKPVLEEVDTDLRLIEGALPADLQGVLFRNGPGRFSIGKDRYDHPFDGDGMVSRFEFDGQKVRYRNAYVKTREFLEEEAAGRMLYRSFGTNIPGGIRKNLFRLKFKNAANTNVIYFAGRLLALWEGGWPHALDPGTLQTLERFHFDGALKNRLHPVDSLINPEMPFSAHPKVDPATGILYNFGTVFGSKNRIVVYSIGPDGIAQSVRHITIPALSFVHDFVITSGSKAIFFCTPVQFDVRSMMMGTSTPAAGMKGDPTQKVRVLVIDLAGPSGEISERDFEVYELPYAFVFHHINAYENEGRILIFSAEMTDFPSAADATQGLQGLDVNYPPTQLVRYDLDSHDRSAKRTPLAARNLELPRIDDQLIGQVFTTFYAAAANDAASFPFLNTIQKINLEGSVEAEFTLANGLVGEPVIARAAGGASYALTLAYNDETKLNEIYLLGADDLKLVARLSLPHSQPIGFHGHWVSAGETIVQAPI